MSTLQLISESPQNRNWPRKRQGHKLIHIDKNLLPNTLSNAAIIHVKVFYKKNRVGLASY